MDSITQIALGAAVGETVLGRQVGRRALIWGGVCGLLPDLDVMIPLTDAVKSFTYHRGPSHSLFVLTALTPLMVWLIVKLHSRTKIFRTRWYVLVLLAFVTHVLLDCLTVYGTQILWPLRTPPTMWSTIFIIDPVYSIPLLSGVLAALVLSRRSTKGHWINTLCLVLSTAYLLWSVAAKVYVTDITRRALDQQKITHSGVLIIPSPFNTLMWRILVMDSEGYYEGFYSLLDVDKAIRFNHYLDDKGLLDGIEDHWPVKRLQWFTRGFYAVNRFVDDIVITDLRMGLEPSYVFRFKVGEAGNPHPIATPSQQVPEEPRWEQLQWVWKRIWTQESGSES